MTNKHWTVEIPLYPEEIQISEKRRPKYYKKGEDIPKKYKDYDFVDGFLVDSESNRIVKNTRSVGKPRFEKVNFQKLWNGVVARHMRAKMADSLHEFYSPHFKKQLPPKIEIGLDECLLVNYDFYNIIDSDSADLDNLAHWHIKTSLDCLTEKNNPNQKNNQKLGIIKDDNLKYVRGIGYNFIECAKSEDRKLVITFALVGKRQSIAFGSAGGHEGE